MRLLDLFCGAGGAAMGYHRAGFEVVGVDIAPRHYPLEFRQADAMTFPLEGFDAIHASPPCQGYSRHVSSASGPWAGTNGRDEPRLIVPLRELLAGIPHVIENVVGAPLRSPILLCGTMFGLPIPRHRLFETWPPIAHWDVPRHPECNGVARRYALERGWDPRDMTVTGKGRRTGTKDRWAEIMAIDWPMTQHEMREAIPPAYTQWIGERLLEALR